MGLSNMAKYTTTIDTLEKNGYKIDFGNYPIFDENYRSVLENKIKAHYRYLYEIGFETPELFTKMLQATMNEIMPYYNILYEAQKHLLDGNLWKNVDLTETKNTQSEGTQETSGTVENKAESTSNGESKQLYQDTPQGKIYENGLENGNWATNFTTNNTETNLSDTSKGSTSTESSVKNTEDYMKNIVGSNGRLYHVEIFERILKNIQNIDANIIEDLSDLFMKIW